MSLAMRKCVSSAPVRTPTVRQVPRVRARLLPVANADKDGAPSSVTQETPKAPVEDMPIWVRRERERELQAKEGKGLPWGLYLLGSGLTAIAAVGCIFEYIDKNPFFGLIQPDSPAWAPILLTLAVTGFPTAGFLFIKGVNAFNEDAERQNRIDGYSE